MSTDEKSKDPFSLLNDLMHVAERIESEDYILHLAFLSEDERKAELKGCMDVLKYLDKVVYNYWSAHRRSIYKRQNEEGWRWN